MTDRRAVRVNNIEWEQVHPDGTKSATLAGRRDAGVQFTYASFIPADVWDAPHQSLRRPARVAVVDGLRLITRPLRRPRRP